MWLIAATVTLDAQTVRTKAVEEMRGALWDESMLWKSSVTEGNEALVINPATTAILVQSSVSVI